MLKTVLKEIKENERIENLVEEFIHRDSIATLDMRANTDANELE